MSIPRIDPRVKHVGVSHLRAINLQSLRDLSDLIVIHDNGEALAVVIPYSMFLELQAERSNP